MLGVKVDQQEGLVVVRFEAGNLNSDEQILRISDELSQVLQSTTAGTTLLLDFRDVEIVASMMLGDLVALNKRALRKGVILQLCGLSPAAMRVIQTCKLDRLFDILEHPLSE